MRLAPLPTAWRDPNGLIYLRSRFYHPGLGMFLSRDPVEGVLNRPMSLNGYSYVEGNPVNLTDPSGECFGPFIIVCAAGIAWALGYLAQQYVIPTLDKSVPKDAPLRGLVDIAHFLLPRQGIIGQLMGWEAVRYETDIVNDPNRSFGERVGQFGSAVVNAALGINLVQTIGQSVLNLGKRGLTGDIEALNEYAQNQARTMTRLQGELPQVVSPEEKIVTNAYRPIGSNIIQLGPKGTTFSAMQHELTHLYQEFAAFNEYEQGIVRFMQQTSAFSTKIPIIKSLGAILPTYLLNPVELHAAAMGGNLLIPVLGAIFRHGITLYLGDSNARIPSYSDLPQFITNWVGQK